MTTYAAKAKLQIVATWAKYGDCCSPALDLANRQVLLTVLAGRCPYADKMEVAPVIQAPSDEDGSRGLRQTRSSASSSSLVRRWETERGKVEVDEGTHAIMHPPHRRPKHQQQQLGQQQHEQERLQQVSSRLQAALVLGLRPTSLEKTTGKKWCNTDAEVQVQATRAIAEFVRTLSSLQGRLSLRQALVEEAVAALDGLLGADREIVYSRALDAAAGLVATMGDSLLGYGGDRLVGPLAQLLKCATASTSVSAAWALHGILTAVRPRTASRDLENGMWAALEDADAISVIVKSIEEETENSGRVAPYIELLAVILERWSESRYRIGCIKTFPATLQLRCVSSNVPVARGALHALTALVLCGCAASLLLKAEGSIWETISFCVHPSRPHSIQLEALRLLSSLSKISTFGESFTGEHVEGIAASCSRALEPVRSLGEKRLAPEDESLIIEAAHATSSVLSWPGLHHIAFVESGIEESLLATLSWMQSTRDHIDQPTQHRTPRSGPRSRGNKINPRLRPLLWEIVGWLGAHHNLQLENHSLPTARRQKVLSKRLPALACNALLKSLWRRGQRPNLHEMDHKLELDLARADAEAGEPVNAQEVLQICKALLLLLSSPSQVIALCTKKCLEDTLVSYGLKWLPSLVTTLTLAGSDATKVNHIQTITNLLALACFSWLDICQEQLLQLKVLGVVLRIVKESIRDSDQKKSHRLSLMSASVYSVGVKACCIDCETWEGCDTVLFCSLWALFRLLQCSGWASKVRETISEHMVDNLAWDDAEGGEILSMLWTVASDKEKSAGVRWWGVCSLACFGIYGFPSLLGKDMKSAVDDSSSADVSFLFGDGSRLSAHGVILATRCESLLPAKLQSKVHVSSVASDSKSSRLRNPNTVGFPHFMGGENEEMVDFVTSAPIEVQVSPRLGRRSLKAILEFVYTGVVYIPLDLVAEMKILATRCQLEPLTSLLQGKSPGWGQPPALCDLSLALDSKRYPLSDILLRSKTLPSQFYTGKFCRACNVIADHLHAHRIVLSSRCGYFQALFRSGMRDSAVKELTMLATIGTIDKLLLYFYSGELTAEGVSDCAWNYSGKDTQLSFLASLVEVAELAGQWVLEDLQELAVALIGAYLNKNIHLCLPILSLAAAKQQWAVLDSCAACLAPLYPQLRDSGALDDLHEGLKDLVRTTYVKLFMK